MNPSYMRIRLPIEEAMLRFSRWVGLVPLEPPQTLDALKVVDAASKNGVWRSLVAVFIYESGEWTVFEDQTGHLASFSADQWLMLAGHDEVVIAGYNDSVPYGQLIVIRAGRVIREFLDDEQDSRQNVNRGRLAFEKESPIKSWLEAASFADGDEIASPPEYGLLWMFGKVADLDVE